MNKYMQEFNMKIMLDMNNIPFINEDEDPKKDIYYMFVKKIKSIF
jgi:hypothetical protein